MSQQGSVSAPMMAALRTAIHEAGGWLPFDRFMALALYMPGLGYYSRDSRQFGWMPASGSDFVTAPELSPLFGRALAAQVAQALQATASDELLEFGAGSGKLAEQLIDALDAAGQPLGRYTIVELSGSLRARQAERLARFGDRVVWAEAWPAAIDGVVIGNEVLDAMPVQLLHYDGRDWFERGVVWQPEESGRQTGSDTGGGADVGSALQFEDRLTALRPPADDTGFMPGTVTEIHPQAEAFVRSLAGTMRRGVALFIDYGFPEAEYYHPQRVGGTLMCHRAHRADDQPLADVGLKDITAHVNFSAIALAAQDAGLDVVGYTSQGRFLLNCGLVDLLEGADLAGRTMAQRLINEHEMGELFKVLALATPGLDLAPIGFASGDRLHRL